MNPNRPDIRRLEGLERQQADYVWSQSFARGDRTNAAWREWEERTPEGRTTYGIFHGAELQAAFLLIAETVQLGASATAAMSAVCGVGVLPASRGRGYATDGMRYLFERMREDGRHLSYLEPFSWRFYQALGYAWTAPTRRYTVPSRLLPASREADHVRAAAEVDRAAVIACYTEMAARYRGMLVRRAEVWATRFDASRSETTYTYIYERDGCVEGYLCYHGGTREQTRLDELIALTPRALKGLLGLLRRLSMQIDTFRWDAPSDDMLWSAVVVDTLTTELVTRTMARMVDVAGALQALRPPAELRGGTTVAVKDASAPWNQRTWQIDFGDGRVAVKPTRRTPHVTLPIQSLVQGYLGSPGVSALRAAGEIDVHNEHGYAALEALLAGPHSWCCDAF